MQKNIVLIEEENEAYWADFSEECYVLSAGLSESYCRAFVQRAREKGRLVLFCGEDAVDKATAFGGDGVILDIPAEDAKKEVQEVRKALGKEGVVGLFTRNRRHESMLVSEAEPDFIIFKVWKDGFDKVKELTDWYSDFFLIQSAAWVMEDGVDAAALRTDFVIKGE